MSVIDHVVLAVPVLDAAVEWFAAGTGVRPAIGGAHVGMGTHNALVSFGSGYVELIAPDPAQPNHQGRRPFGIDDLAGRALVAFAIRPEPGRTIDDVIRSAIEAGYEPGEAASMSRRTPHDELLSWRLTFPRTTWSGVDLHGTVPFVIDWGDTSLPSTTAPGGIELAEFTIEHSEPDTISAAHRALGIETVVRGADRPALIARFTGPRGSLDV